MTEFFASIFAAFAIGVMTLVATSIGVAILTAAVWIVFEVYGIDVQGFTA